MNSNKQIFTNHWTSIFFNPLYLIRSALYKEISVRSKYLKGRLLDFGCGTKPYKHLFNNVEEYVGLDFASDRVKGEKTETDIVYDGKNIPEDLKTQQYPNVFIEGFVPDISIYFKGADIFLNPVMDGGGV
ncbi:MAG: hypothetical protein QM528_08490 [Phycisphaerales bacterium]|nr:hypothetical protein [Phycisphaerales bacterium]